MEQEQTVAAAMAEQAADLAELINATGDQLHLDGTPSSAYDLDDVLERAAAEQPELFEKIAPSAGAYLGELVVRGGGGTWLLDQAGDPCVRTRTGWVWWPMRSITRRGTAGAPTLPLVYVYAMAGADVPDPSTLGVVPRFGTDLGRSQWSWAAFYAAQMALTDQQLTWDLASVEILERECQRVARPSMTDEDAEEYAVPMGAYLGEVLRGLLGGHWTFVDTHAALYVNERVTAFPIGKIVKRLVDGPEDDLVDFCEMTARLARGDLD